MTNQNELLSLIDKQIDAIDQFISSISPEKNEQTIKNKNLIEKNISLSQFNFLNDFDINELRQILPTSFENDITNLLFYINTLNTSYANELAKQPKVKEQIKSILYKIHSYLTELVNQQIQDKRKAITLENTKIKLETIKSKIVSSEKNFDDFEIEFVYSMLNSLEDRNKAIELLILFGEEILKSKEIPTNVQNEEEQFIENKDKIKIKEELITIFNKYLLDFDAFYNKLSSVEQTEFINYVKPYIVEEILRVLKEFNINLSDSYYNCPLLLYKARQIKEILMYSNGKTIKKVLAYTDKEKIFNNRIIEQNGNTKKGIDFDLLLESPARFIERKRRYKVKGNNIIDIKIEGDSIGAANDFINNIELFKSYGVNPSDLCENSIVSILPTEKIRNIISIFKLYGIDSNYFTKTLSCFDSIHQADALDQFIELGQFDYILRNMSRCKLLPDSPIFYRLIYGIKYTTIPIESMITKKGNFTSLITDTSKKDNSVTFGITAINKQTMVNQSETFYGNDQLYQTYNELVNPLSSDITVALSRNDSIIHLLDENFLVKKGNGEMIYPNIYNFGTVNTIRGKWDINISRNKVLRICNELMKHNIEINDMDTIMYIVTKNSILTQEEYNIIYNQINNIRKRGVEK